MIFSVFIIVLVIPFIRTQYASKCNIPVFGTWIVNRDFIDYRFPIDSISVINKYEDLLTPYDSLNFPFWEDFGSIWRITKSKNFIEIEFTDPILISSFAITSCTEIAGKCTENNPDTNSTFTFDYKERVNTVFNRLKPVHFPNGNLLLENQLDGLPTEVSFKPIQAESVRLTKKYPLSDTTNADYFVQFEIFGCIKLPENIISLNPNILHYDVTPSFTMSATNTLMHGWCSEYGCNGLSGTLIDGNIVLASSLSLNSQNLIKWISKGTEGQSISVKLYFSGYFQLNYLVIHSIYDGDRRIWIPDVHINGTKYSVIVNKPLSGTSHAIIELHGSIHNQLTIEFGVQHDVSLILSEMEVFGMQKVTQNSKSSFELGEASIPLFISSVYFTITLALIIPLLISVVVICFRIKKQTKYLPNQQSTRHSNYSHLFSSKEILRCNGQSNNSNSRMTSFDPTQETVPIATDTNFKRLDSNTLNNMYERIPTLPGGHETTSLKRTKLNYPKDELFSSQTGSETTTSPIYSVPHKKNRPASNGGYLELRNLSVDERIPAIATPQDDDPYYDYVRPISAFLPLQLGSKETVNEPIREYLNTSPLPKYINATSNNTAL